MHRKDLQKPESPLKCFMVECFRSKRVAQCSSNMKVYMEEITWQRLSSFSGWTDTCWVGNAYRKKYNGNSNIVVSEC